MAKIPITQQRGNHQALRDFMLFTDRQLPTLIDNALLLRKYVPSDIGNPILLFVMPRGIDGLVYQLVLETEQAWRILNNELHLLNEVALSGSDRDYCDLKRIRNKLCAHYIEVSLSTDEHRDWYRKTYGSYEKIFGLISKISEKISSKVEELICRHKLLVHSAQTKVSKRIEIKDIDMLLNSLKKENIY